MNARSGSYAARKVKFMEKREEIQRYFDTQGSTWLGQLLNTMSNVASANFDRDNNAQYRNEKYKDFNDFIADPKLARVAESDEHFSVCLSFAHMFGLFVEEVNAHADEGTSVLFRPATVQSRKDPNRPSSSANSRILSMAVPHRAAVSNRKDDDIEALSDDEEPKKEEKKKNGVAPKAATKKNRVVIISDDSDFEDINKTKKSQKKKSDVFDSTDDSESEKKTRAKKKAVEKKAPAKKKKEEGTKKVTDFNKKKESPKKKKDESESEEVIDFEDESESEEVIDFDMLTESDSD